MFNVVDMAGNVWEWCLTEYNTGSDIPDYTANKVERILRGGSWKVVEEKALRASFRVWSTPDKTDQDWGFRCVRLPI